MARAIHEAGGRAVLVGGYVRDTLLEIPSKDVDIEVFGLDIGALEDIDALLAGELDVRENRRVSTTPRNRTATGLAGYFTGQFGPGGGGRCWVATPAIT